MKECKLVSVRPQKGHPIADLDYKFFIPIRGCTRFELVGYFCRAKRILCLENLSTRIRTRFQMFLDISSNKVMDKPFVAPMGTRIQIGTRVYISLILHHS
jgi:hypothetical protein